MSATVLPLDAAPAAVRDVLVCMASGRRFGVPLGEVREAARLTKLAPLPGAPASFVGVALVRGEPHGIVDAGALLGLRAAAVAKPGLAVVLRRPLALLVDRIEGVQPEELAAAAGVGRLDLDALLGPPPVSRG